MVIFGESKEKRYARDLRKAYNVDQLPKEKKYKHKGATAHTIINRIKERRKLKSKKPYSSGLPTHGTGSRSRFDGIKRKGSKTAWLIRRKF